MAISKESVRVGSIELESEGDLGSRYIIILGDGIKPTEDDHRSYD